MDTGNEKLVPDRKDLHQLGTIIRLHGFRGELTGYIETDNIRDYTGLRHLFLDTHGTLVPYDIDLIEYKTNTTVKMKLAGIDTEEKAKQLVKSRIYIDKRFMSEEDESKVALRTITGFRVIDAAAGEIGTVKRIEEINKNPLLVVLSGAKEILIPLNEQFFQKIDRRKKEVHISAPEGLIEFYLGQ
jgi:16S rRNA processing protein RimM